MVVTITKPTIGGSEDSWGLIVNTALDDIVDGLNGVTTVAPNLTEGSWQIGGVAVGSTAAELNILDGVTASTAEINVLDGVTASTAEINVLTGATVSTAEINYLDGATSSIQDQIDSIVASGGAGDGTITLSAGSGIGGGGSFTTNQSSASSISFTVGAGNGLSQTADGLAMSGSYSGAFTATGDITAFSDAALKSDIETISDALQRVTQMRGVFFDKDGRRGTGVIAQEVQKAVPEAVHDSGEYLSVAYGNLVGVLIEAVKELATEVKALKDGVTK